jgi:SNF2 family DNA or RNA helicase
MSSSIFTARLKALELKEKLLLKRNPLDYQSYVETFRESLIDANPHQIESIIFALEKLENGGCILADEVGLGKTIEAGLIMAQYRANRYFNILIIVPTSLAGQWNNELRSRFQIPSRIITSKDKIALAKSSKSKSVDTAQLFQEDGVYIVGREFASRLQKERALGKKQWDLIVVDEAHEIFSNIYQRFNTKTGIYNEDSTRCTTAGNLFRLFKRTPLLLLTATPLQNNILEIWGLSSYILPEGNKSYLGQFNHFKKLFIQNGEPAEEKIPELKDRLSNFLIRNLRVNAQTYMKYKFTDRHCETVNFNMEQQEKALYDSITDYLERDDIYAYSLNGMIDLSNDRMGGIRNLLKMSYRRALGSSFSALKESLKGIVVRLNKMKAGGMAIPSDIELTIATDDTENDEEDRLNTGFAGAIEDITGSDTDNGDIVIESKLAPGDIEKIEYEIKEVKSYIERAEKLTRTGKDQVLINWLKTIFSNPQRFFQKTVIFTTYVATQRHLKRVLEEEGFRDEVILFSGGKRTDDEKETLAQALTLWEDEIGSTLPPMEKPSGNILERTALVHYFKTRKKIFISTEAGAKGLNLQFCNTLINYDLPWNPQRIEQRIGRCHRYGQEKDVWVINCINADNETEKRIYELLLNKFSLFKSVLGAGDDILGTLSKAIQFETKINDMMNQFKTNEERLIWLERFEEEIDDETRKLRDHKISRTRQLLDELDPNVIMRLNNIKEKLPESFSQYDKDMLELLRNYAILKELSFDTEEIEDDKNEQENRHVFFHLDNRPYYIGKRDEDAIRNRQHISLKHPLLQQVIEEIDIKGERMEAGVILDYSGSANASRILQPFTGKQGRWDFYNVRFSGIEEEEHLFDSIAIETPEGLSFLNDEEVKAIRTLPVRRDDTITAAVAESQMESHRENQVNDKFLVIQKTQQPRLDKKLRNLEAELRDMQEYLENKQGDAKTRMDELDQKIRSTFDRSEGQKLLKQKETLQKELKDIRKELLTFQLDFQETFDQEERKLMDRRFIKTAPRPVYTLHFKIV